MNRWTIFPLLWPVLLMLGGQSCVELRELRREQRHVEARRDDRLRELEALRAKTVAGRLDGQEYNRLLTDLAALTQLPASDPFRDPQQTTLGSVHVASLIDGLQKALASGGPGASSSAPDVLPVKERLRFLSVSPGDQQRTGPFVMIEFVLNLKGRFRAIPPFLATLTRLGKRRNLAISIGVLRIASTELTPVNGDLEITLPVRAYYRD